MKNASDVLLDRASMAADATSDAVLIDQIYGYTCQCIYTGSPVGNLKIQATNELPNDHTEVPTTWNDLSTLTVAISASGSTMVSPVQGQFYKYFRVKYERTSGSGNLTVRYFGKG